MPLFPFLNLCQCPDPKECSTDIYCGPPLVNIGVETNDSIVVALQKIDAAMLAANPFKIYAALLTQSGLDAPTATVQSNTVGAVTFQYITTGVYWMVLTGAFPQLKTNVLSSNNNTLVKNRVEYSVDANNGRIIIHTFDVNGFPSNNLLQKQSIEIKVYN